MSTTTPPQTATMNAPASGLAELPPRTRSLQRRVMVWTLALIALPTFAGTYWIGQVTDDTMAAAHLRNAGYLSQTLAASLAGRLEDGWSTEAHEVLDTLRFDRRVVMVAVQNTTGHTLHERVYQAEPFAAYQAETGRPSTRGVPAAISEDGALVANQVAIWRVEKAPGVGMSKQLDGYVTLVMHDHDRAPMIDRLRAAQVFASALACLFMIPIVVWVVRRWLSPLRTLLTATRDLLHERRPEPVKTDRLDEIGQLAEGFNTMTDRLMFTRGQLVMHNAQLEVKIRNRTEALEKVNTKLEDEIKDKNEFLRAVSHDLKAPLRNITGMTRMLLMKYEAEMQDDMIRKLERIAANAKHQTELIQDLLDLSKLRTTEGKKQHVELGELVREIGEHLAHDLEEKNISLEFAGDFPAICAERNRLRQVFQNLMDNAVKYMMDAENRRITVACLADTAEPTRGACYHFVVRDTGRGIAEEDLGGVFQVFRRATHSGTHQVEGRGVGLASVKSIVEQLGGEIWVESTLGEGSAFHITLPLSHVALPDDDSPAEAVVSAEAHRTLVMGACDD